MKATHRIVKVNEKDAYYDSRSSFEGVEGVFTLTPGCPNITQDVAGRFVTSEGIVFLGYDVPKEEAFYFRSINVEVL